MIVKPLLSCFRNLADLDRDGKMTMQEFTIAVHLIQSKLKGSELPTSLPNSLKMTSMPSTFLIGQKTKPPSDWNQPTKTSLSNGFSKAGAMTLPKPAVLGISWSGINQSPPLTRAVPTPSASVFGSSFGSGSPSGTPSGGLSSPFGAGMSSGMNSLSGNTLMLNGPGSLSSGVPAPNNFGPAPPSVHRANSLTGGFGPAANPYGTILPANRLKYNQLFKANDFKKTGFLSGRDIVSNIIIIIYWYMQTSHFSMVVG